MGAVVRLTPKPGAVVESVDTPDLKSVGHYARESSSLSRPIGTILCHLSTLLL